MDTLALPLALYLAATYLICGIPFGKLVASAGDVDIRSVGSGNIGTTNVGRALGAPAAGITLLLDAGKGFVCTFFARPILAAVALSGDAAPLACDGELGWVMALVYLMCIVGHVFSPYLAFRGGKGIAVGFGGALGFAWPVALGLLLVWALVMAPTRIVSAASCAADVSLPIWSYVFYQPGLPFMAIMCLITAIVLWAHRSNLRKLAHGEEKRFSFHHEPSPKDPPDASEGGRK